MTERARMIELFAAGRAARAAGNHAATRAYYEQACEIALRTQPDSQETGVVCHSLASVYLARRECLADAAALLERACAIAARTSGMESLDHAQSLAQLAVAVEVNGDADRAAALYAQAFPIYERAPEADPREYAAFLSGAGHLHLKHARPAEALAAFARALAMCRALDADAATLAGTIADVATAQFELGNLADAVALYREALMLRPRATQTS